jgi:Outer membrane protein beta-barrel domain
VSQRTLLFFLLAAAGAFAQDSKINSNLGMGLSVPLNPTAGLVGASVNAVVGVGYNINRHHSLVGQFMWSGLPANRNALLPVWNVVGATNIGSSSNLFAVTGNYRYQVQKKTFGVYVIAGAGVYYRQASLSRQVIVGAGTACSPSWAFFGYTCVSGVVSQDPTLISGGSTAPGANAGIGFTIRITEDGYKFYVESRYHYASTRGVATTLIPITLGFSW